MRRRADGANAWNEVAVVMGISNGNARKRLFRARKRLHTEVARREAERPPESGHLPPGEGEPEQLSTEEVSP